VKLHFTPSRAPLTFSLAFALAAGAAFSLFSAASGLGVDEAGAGTTGVGEAEAAFVAATGAEWAASG